jgi:Protein-disulfide isomerase
MVKKLYLPFTVCVLRNFFMRNLVTLSLLLLLSLAAFAQRTEPVLATANGRNYTAKNLSPDLEKAWRNLPSSVAEMRGMALSQMIAEALFEAEAKARGISVEKLLEGVKAKVADPKDSEIEAVYEANRDALGGKSLDEVKPQIVAFLRREPEQKAIAQFVDVLRKKYKIAVLRNVNAPALKPADVLATVNGKAITVQAFEAKNRIAFYEMRAEVFDAVRHSLEETIFQDLVQAEAKAQNIEPSNLLAREITDRMRDFSNEERETLSEDFRSRLFTKYNVKFLLKEPEPVVQKISVDDDPSRGSANAPVTIVMFSDFQCPACSAAHPILEKVLAEYGDKVRFVVRDFPLEKIHKDAFLAAQAANAAHAQGKFFEYIDVLYRNQSALDIESLKKYAAELGLNTAQFELDLQSGKYADEVRRDIADGVSYGITGTPAIFVNGVKLRHISAKDFRAAIERALAQSAPAAKTTGQSNKARTNRAVK